MQTRLAATPEEIAKVLEVLKRFGPQGAVIEQIEEETGYPIYTIHSAIDALERQGSVQGKDLFGRDRDAVDSDADGPEGVTS